MGPEFLSRIFKDKSGKEEMKNLAAKFVQVKKRENLVRVVGFIYSRTGFTPEAEVYCKVNGNACSEDEGRLETSKRNLTVRRLLR